MFAIDGQLVSSLGTALHTSALIITPHSSNHILGVNGNKFNINQFNINDFNKLINLSLINTSRSTFYVLGTVPYDLQVLTHLTCIIMLMRYIYIYIYFFFTNEEVKPQTG